MCVLFRALLRARGWFVTTCVHPFLFLFAAAESASAGSAQSSSGGEEEEEEEEEEESGSEKALQKRGKYRFSRHKAAAAKPKLQVAC